MKKTYLIIVGFILFLTSHSQIHQINDSSMYGGKIRAHAKNSNCVLIGTEGGIFKTTNQGVNWTNVSQNFDPYSISCDQLIGIGNDFYAMPNNSNTQRIYKSTNDGTSWSEILTNAWWPQSIGKISNTLYAIGNDFSGGYLYSTSDGSNWTQKALLWNNQWQGGNCKMMSFNQNKLFLAYHDSLFFTTDGMNIDTVTFAGLGSSYFSGDDNSFGGDANGNLYYSGDNVVYKYNFISKSWTDISTSQIPIGFMIMEMSVTENAIFIVAMSQTLGIRLYKSTNQGSSFSEITNTGLSFSMINNIIEVSTNGFIGNGLDERILLSSNGGNTWTWNNNQFIATYTGNLTRSGNSILFSREVKGLIRSSNQGSSWEIANTGIPGFSGIAYFVNEITQVKDTLFAICRPDPFSEQSVLYKSTNNGVSWFQHPIPSPYNAGEDQNFAGKCDSALFVNYYDTLTQNYAVIVTYNNGASWSKPNNQNSNEKTYFKGTKNCLYAFTASNNNWDNFDNVYKANNFGSSFTDINTGNIFNSNIKIKRVLNDDGDKGNAMMDFDVLNNKAFFAVKDWSVANGSDKLFANNMTTNTWSEISTIGLPANYQANCIKYIGNNIWILATNSGIYKSINAGVNWTLTHNAGEWQNGIVVNNIENIGNKIFLGTTSNGVWVLDLTSGIMEPAAENNLQLFPNPSNGIINIEIPDLINQNVNICIYGIDGKMIMNKNMTHSPFQIDLENVNPGSYIIVVESDNKVYKKTIIRK